MKSLVFKTVQSLRSPALEQKYSLSKCMYMEFFSMESGYMVCVKHIKTWGNIHIQRSKNLSVLYRWVLPYTMNVVCFCTCGITASVPSFDLLCDYVVVAVQSLSCVPLFATPWTAAHQALLFFTISQSLLRLMSSEMMMPSKLSYPPLPPSPSAFNLSQRQFFFPMSWLFASDDQSIGASASVLPMNIQDWFTLELTGLISLLSKGLSRVFSSTTIRKHQLFGT